MALELDETHRTPAHPSNGKILQSIGKTVLFFGRWTAKGTIPEGPRGVFIAAPHTSNWDLIYMLACAWALRVRLSWVGKDTLFKGPMGPFLRAMGGIPIIRDKKLGTVGSLAATFNDGNNIYLSIPPSGTRSKRDHWKSGFYWVAQQADVPIICGYLDYKTRSGGIGPVIHTTGDIKADMDKIRAFYTPLEGKLNHNKSAIRLKDEDDVVGSPPA